MHEGIKEIFNRHMVDVREDSLPEIIAVQEEVKIALLRTIEDLTRLAAQIADDRIWSHHDAVNQAHFD